MRWYKKYFYTFSIDFLIHGCFIEENLPVDPDRIYVTGLSMGGFCTYDIISLIFAIYEIGSLQENEEVIEEIYTNQLDAILYSVNQYSEDVVSSWASRIDSEQKDESELQVALDAIYQEMPSVEAILQFDTLGNEIASASNNEIPRERREQVNALLNEQKDMLNRLKSYIKSRHE